MVDLSGLGDGGEGGGGVSVYPELYDMSDKNCHNREREACLCVCLFVSCTHVLLSPLCVR